MDKKKYSDDLKGFEEFIESQPNDQGFLPKIPKKEVSFEHLTFLTNDSERLLKIKNLLSTKIPFANSFDQGEKILIAQKEEIKKYKSKLFTICDAPNSQYRKSTADIFDSYFAPPAP